MVEVLTAQVDVLEAENAELKRRLGQNSRNSSAGSSAMSRTSRWRAGRSGNHQIRFGGRPRGKGPAQRLAPRCAADPSGWIIKHCRCVRDYETLPSHHEAMVYIAMIMTMSRRLTRTEDR
jgi:hypothetical protein